MKKLIRYLLFVKRVEYEYPYSERNLDNTIGKIVDSKYFDFKVSLLGKIVSNEQFELWEKWNFGLGARGFWHYSRGNAYFVGTKIIQSNRVLIEGMVFPNPFKLVTTYIALVVLALVLYFTDFSEATLHNSKFTFLIIVVIFLQVILSGYFTYRLRRKVEKQLELIRL